jgi:hypothetical protein
MKVRLNSWRPTLLFSVALTTASLAQNQGRIVGGNLATEGDYPWMTALVEKGANAANGQFCGAALIDPNWIVTAAHCAEGVTPNNTEVIVGAYDLRNGQSGQRIAITEVKIHSGYRESNEGNLDNDIALFRLARPVTDVGTISLVTAANQITAGTTATAIGFGLTSDGGSASSTLRDVEVPIVSQSAANAAYNGLNDTHLAAGLAAGGRDSCQGDSGGPLVVNTNGQWALAGITSFGDGCARPGAYGVYANVLTLRNWILTQMGQPNPNPTPDPEPNPTPDPEPFLGGDGNDDHGDEPDSATIVSVPSETNGALEESFDFDVFTFDLSSPATVTVETLGSTDTYGYLDSEFEELAADDSSGSQGNFRITEDLEAGRYFVYVEAFDPSTQVGSYSLKVSSDREEIGVATLEVYKGDSEVGGAVDFGHQVVNSGSVTETFTLLNSGNADLLVNAARLAGADRQEFAITAQPSDRVEPGRSTAISIRYNPSSPDSHRAALVILSNDPDRGRFVVRLTGTGIAPASNDDDHGDDMSTATLVDAPSTVEGILDVGGDVDVFSFEIDRKAKVIIRTRSDIDTYGILMNEDGDIIAENDDSGSGFNFRLRRRLPAGVYYVAVEGWDDSVSGDYDLNIRVR